MIVTEMYKGQGLGNQLFCYVTTRCIAADNGCKFGLITPENIANNIHSTNGAYFMDLYIGEPVNRDEITNHYTEKEMRLKMDNGQRPFNHDQTIGIDIRMYDPNLVAVSDNTKIDGIMQSEDYFYHRKAEIREWLKVKPEYEYYDLSSNDICVLHIRDYGNDPALQLTRNYWVKAIHNMLSINPNMTFAVISNSTEYCKKLLPELADNVFSFDIGKDYSIIKNAKYLILGNSSFAFFPAWTSETVRMVIAPKYWARHNVSSGYWACSYNLYRDWYYMDREGVLFSYDECKRELDLIIERNPQVYLQ